MPMISSFYGILVYIYKEMHGKHHVLHFHAHYAEYEGDLMLRPVAVEVTPQSDFTLIITFNNSEKRIFDVKPYFDVVPYSELRNLAIFNTVKPAGFSIAWIHGQDICPDDLYYNSKPA